MTADVMGDEERIQDDRLTLDMYKPLSLHFLQSLCRVVTIKLFLHNKLLLTQNVLGDYFNSTNAPLGIKHKQNKVFIL